MFDLSLSKTNHMLHAHKKGKACLNIYINIIILKQPQMQFRNLKTSQIYNLYIRILNYICDHILCLDFLEHFILE